MRGWDHRDGSIQRPCARPRVRRAFDIGGAELVPAKAMELGADAIGRARRPTLRSAR
jgi:hypothetical protein